MTFAIAVVLASLAPAIAAQLIVVEDSRCEACVRFEGSVGNSYNSTPQGRKAPLRRVNIANKVPSDLARIPFHGSIRGTPVFLLIDHGRVIGTFDGFATAAVFWQKIDDLLRRVGT
jgi:hypothetical protein